MKPIWITPQELAKELKVSDRTVRNWCQNGQLSAVRVGRQYRMRRSEVDAFLEHGRTAKPEFFHWAPSPDPASQMGARLKKAGRYESDVEATVQRLLEKRRKKVSREES